MNLNKKIKKFTGDGIPAYNAKIDELIDAANWLLGMRSINGKPITESDQGPVIDLSQVNATQAGPLSGDWQTDPNGNKAGWFQVIVLDPNYATNGKSDVCWVWSGGALSQSAIPWMTDPSGVPAGWIVCAQPTFWGTGTCPVGGGGNFQEIGYSANGQPGVNPYILTGNVPTPPIVPPTNPPAFYLMAPSADNVWSGLPRQPCLEMTVGLEAGDSGLICDFSWAITYDGTTVFSLSSSANVIGPQGQTFYLVDPTNWIYDPGGLPGYSQGSKMWIYQYQGTISTNTNPTFTETFSYSVSPISRLAQVSLWNTMVLTK